MKSDTMKKATESVKDPIVLIGEILNLKELFEEKVALMGILAGTTHSFTPWDIRSKIPGYYTDSPENRWYDKVVSVDGLEEYGPGHIIAMKKVGDFYLPGVQLEKPIPNGHALSFRDHGQAGLEGHCLWVWLDKVKIMNQDFFQR